MKKELDKLIQKIQDGITVTFQNNVFDDGDFGHKVLVGACKEFLIYKGYKVVDPVKYVYNVKNIDGLIHLFYVFSDSKHPELINSFRNVAKDRKIASLFVQARMGASNVNKKEALKECAEIITTIFKHENEFNFNIPLVFGILGQQKLGWVTDKAISIINKEKQNSENERRNELISSYEESYNVEPGGFGNLEEILKKL